MGRKRLLIGSTDNEICTCKHTRFAHQGSYQHCLHKECTCTRFTWDAYNHTNKALLAEAAKRWEG